MRPVPSDECAPPPPMGNHYDKENMSDPSYHQLNRKSKSNSKDRSSQVPVLRNSKTMHANVSSNPILSVYNKSGVKEDQDDAAAAAVTPSPTRERQRNAISQISNLPIPTRSEAADYSQMRLLATFAVPKDGNTPAVPVENSSTNHAEVQQSKHSFQMHLCGKEDGSRRLRAGKLVIEKQGEYGDTSVPCSQSKQHSNIVDANTTKTFAKERHPNKDSTNFPLQERVKKAKCKLTTTDQKSLLSFQSSQQLRKDVPKSTRSRMGPQRSGGIVSHGLDKRNPKDREIETMRRVNQRVQKMVAARRRQKSFTFSSSSSTSFDVAPKAKTSYPPVDIKKNTLRSRTVQNCKRDTKENMKENSIAPITKTAQVSDQMIKDDSHECAFEDAGKLRNNSKFLSIIGPAGYPQERIPDYTIKVTDCKDRSSDEGDHSDLVGDTTRKTESTYPNESIVLKSDTNESERNEEGAACQNDTTAYICRNRDMLVPRDDHNGWCGNSIGDTSGTKVAERSTSSNPEVGLWNECSEDERATSAVSVQNKIELNLFVFSQDNRHTVKNQSSPSTYSYDTPRFGSNEDDERPYQYTPQPVGSDLHDLAEPHRNNRANVATKETSVSLSLTAGRNDFDEKQDGSTDFLKENKSTQKVTTQDGLVIEYRNKNMGGKKKKRRRNLSNKSNSILPSLAGRGSRVRIML